MSISCGISGLLGLLHSFRGISAKFAKRLVRHILISTYDYNRSMTVYTFQGIHTFLEIYGLNRHDDWRLNLDAGWHNMPPQSAEKPQTIIQRATSLNTSNAEPTQA
jgi:hypothetical protein